MKKVKKKCVQLKIGCPVLLSQHFYGGPEPEPIIGSPRSELRVAFLQPVPALCNDHSIGNCSNVLDFFPDPDPGLLLL